MATQNALFPGLECKTCRLAPEGFRYEEEEISEAEEAGLVASLRVSASAGSNREQAIAIFEDDRAFLHLVRRASLNADVVRTLKRRSSSRLVRPGNAPFVKALELTDEQLMLWGSWDGTHCLLRQTRRDAHVDVVQPWSLIDIARNLRRASKAEAGAFAVLSPPPVAAPSMGAAIAVVPAPVV
jgi:hypothetical protein